MATLLVAAALSTAIVGFVWLIVLASRSTRRGIVGARPASGDDVGPWLYYGAGAYSGRPADDRGHHGHGSGEPGSDGHVSGGHESGSSDSGSDGGGGDGGGGGGGD